MVEGKGAAEALRFAGPHLRTPNQACHLALHGTGMDAT
jgi:hypothetical protein